MRIFWLGMHKILVRTELPRLRSLGYEVFTPPYLSPIVDQSAELNWERDQVSTLPKEIFEKLSKYNFFYNSIDRELAEILNSYFDVVIVTINSTWLASIVKVFKKKIIFRTYGQPEILAIELKNLGVFEQIAERDNFFFVPHSIETVQDEHTWLASRATVVPYALTDDTFKFQDTYDLNMPKKKEIMLSCPNIDNPMYREHFLYLKENYSNPIFRYYGVQLRKVNDSQIIGTISRETLIQSFQNSAGYLYNFKNPRVCYLPPIEMMIVGGPVVFLTGSLLDRISDSNSPGRAKDDFEADQICQKLAKGDLGLAKEIISYQEKVRSFYSPNTVWPIFDKVFNNLLNDKIKQEASPLTSLSTGKKHIYLLHHFSGQPISFNEGKYSAFEGIPRVMRVVAESLKKQSNIEFIITCRKDQLDLFHGYFTQNAVTSNIRFLPIDRLPIQQVFLFRILSKTLKWVKLLRIKLKNNRHNESGLLQAPAEVQKPKTKAEKLEQVFIGARRSKPVLLAHIKETILFCGVVFLPLVQIALISVKKAKIFFGVTINKIIQDAKGYYKIVLQVYARQLYLEVINKDQNCHSVIVPHYYLFPEAIQIDKPIALYLPDYIPHFFEETNDFNLDAKTWQIGKAIADKAHKIFSNSHFTKNYLPETKLAVDSSKIEVFYLPNLNSSHSDNSSIDIEFTNEVLEIKEKLAGAPFIFYPTQARPSKNLSFLLEVFSELRKIKPEYKLLLTDLTSDSKALRTYKKLKLRSSVVIAPRIANCTLEWLYRKADVLTFTSLIEGNFPTQIYEALEYNTPIVATKLPLITERLKDQSDLLLLVEPRNKTEFIEKLIYCIGHPGEIRAKQKMARDIIASQSTFEAFTKGILNTLDLN
jgi:glycosyltransferase involved in cell wall biosynthesis